MLTLQVKEDEIVQITDGVEQILVFAHRRGNHVKLKIHADKKWRVHRGTVEEASKRNDT